MLIVPAELLAKSEKLRLALENLPTHGKPIEKPLFDNMCNLYLKRLDKASQHPDVGVVLESEPSAIKFSKTVLLPLLKLEECAEIRVFFALTKSDMEPPTPMQLEQLEAIEKQEADGVNGAKERRLYLEQELQLVHTVVIAGFDKDGIMLKDSSDKYELYDYGGHCCNKTLKKKECLADMIK
ncbi:MAG: hypothetical protein ICV83_00810 [Cytophagales bacterium]|nr:hypothetical protein [Cytophagales bacterium]